MNTKLIQPLACLLLAMSICLGAYAQKYYNQQVNFLKANSNWVFGYKAGLNFNSGRPQGIKTGIDKCYEGSSSVSDPVTGKLLFYTSGGQCWNANHEIMPNGDSLLGNSSLVNDRGTIKNIGGTTTAQGSCIVPVIDMPGKYYIFSLFSSNSGRLFGIPPPFLYYSIVDMNLDGGKGDIEPGRKNIVLDKDTLSEAMIAIPGDNCDVWLMVHNYGKPAFKAYHITKNGINPTPVISVTGHSIQGLAAYDQNYMAVSPDRKMLAITSMGTFVPPYNRGVLLGRFDPSSGQVTNARKVSGESSYAPVDTAFYFSVIFSPDNSKMYVTATPTIMGGVYSLFQYDVSNFDSAAIASSRTYIASSNPASTVSTINCFRLYNDTIYFLNEFGSTIRDYNDEIPIGRINQPNLPGLACGFEKEVVSLASGSATRAGLGSDVVYPLAPDTVCALVLDTLLCNELATGLSLKPKLMGQEYTYVWDNGSTGSTRKVTGGGSYWVKYNNGCHYRTDTFVLRFSELDAVITVNVFDLSTTLPYQRYQWFLNGQLIEGATNRIYTVLENGDYTVVVTDDKGCMDTSVRYKVSNVSVKEREYLAAQIRAYPNPAQDYIFIQSPVAVRASLSSVDGRVWKTMHKTNQISMKDLPEGLYMLHLMDSNGHFIKAEKVIKLR